MSKSWTYADLEKTGLAFTDGRERDQKPATVARASKYGNIKTEVDGVVFDSQREANRYIVLRGLLENGILLYLFTQYEFELNGSGKYSYKYKADFVYAYKRRRPVHRCSGAMIVEDCKGALTAVYKKKKRLMKKIYNIEIKET